MDTQLVAGVFAGLMTVLAFAPIIISVRRNNMRPHRTSWFIWSATYIVILAEQLSTRSGPIVIRTSVSAAIALYLFVYAVRNQIYPFSKKTLYPMAFIVCVSVYAMFFASPLQTILLMCGVCSSAILPLFIQVHRDPWSESLTLISANGIASVFALLSLGHNPSIPKLAFPVFILGATCILVAITIKRRKYWERRPSIQEARVKLSESRPVAKVAEKLRF